MTKKKAHLQLVGDDNTSVIQFLVRILSENERLKSEYDKLHRQLIHVLMRCLEERDAYTYGHCMRVMEYALLIGRAYGLNAKDLMTLELTAMFHDMGKIGVPDCVLLKPGRLDKNEADIIKAHAEKGGEILELVDALREVAWGVRHHHERIDGEGYPDSLSGNQIPVVSRIILVADTFDAMTSTRPYRKGLPFDTAYSELERFSGAQFDSEFVKVFLEEHKKLVGLAPGIKIKKAA